MATVRVTIPMDAEQVAILTKAATGRGGTLSGYVQSVLSEFVERQNGTFVEKKQTKQKIRKRRKRKK